MMIGYEAKDRIDSANVVADSRIGLIVRGGG